MPGDSEATKKRLLAAATEEFAAYGLAGARVDRIAGAARANKAQIYHYFDSKEGLFDAVWAAYVDEMVGAVSMDVADLPEYAALLFDRYESEPDARRLSMWRRLERGGPHPPVEGVVKENQSRIDAIAEAQRQGQLPNHFSAIELITLVLTIAAMWTTQSPELARVLRKSSRARRREVVKDAVRALLVV
jgi:AcrR family transcriptional regulator